MRMLESNQNADLEGARPCNIYEPNHFYISKSTSKTLSPPHYHNYLQFWYILKGSLIHNIYGKRLKQSRGDFLIVPPYLRHNIDTRDSEDLQFIFCELADDLINYPLATGQNDSLFSLTYLQPLVTGITPASPYVNFNEQSTVLQIEQILGNLLHEFQQLSNFSLSYIRSNLVKLFSLVAMEYTKNFSFPEDKLSKYRVSIQQALDFIDEHYTQNISLNQICKIAMMSTSSFSYVFKNITGKTFIEYINYLRVHRARTLIVDTDWPMVDICMDCGFCDTAYFDNTFKRMTGVTPSTYRRNAKLPSIKIAE